jgi:SAM-dependent methyltransferase
MKQFSPACERNKGPILAALRDALRTPGLVLEIGSGTGQHAVFFAEHLPQLQWQPTDLAENLAGIRAWCADSRAENLLAPRVLDLLAEQWPVTQAEAIVCINTIHIVSWLGVQRLFAGAGKILEAGGRLFVYGPYRYANRPFESSNQQFDQCLQARDPASGVRDFEAVDALARAHGMRLVEDRAMPANNRCIWWVKKKEVASNK